MGVGREARRLFAEDEGALGRRDPFKRCDSPSLQPPEPPALTRALLPCALYKRLPLLRRLRPLNQAIVSTFRGELREGRGDGDSTREPGPPAVVTTRVHLGRFFTVVELALYSHPELVDSR